MYPSERKTTPDPVANTLYTVRVVPSAWFIVTLSPTSTVTIDGIALAATAATREFPSSGVIVTV